MLNTRSKTEKYEVSTSDDDVADVYIRSQSDDIYCKASTGLGSVDKDKRALYYTYAPCFSENEKFVFLPIIGRNQLSPQATKEPTLSVVVFRFDPEHSNEKERLINIGIRPCPENLMVDLNKQAVNYDEATGWFFKERAVPVTPHLSTSRHTAFTTTSTLSTMTSVPRSVNAPTAIAPGQRRNNG